VPKRRFEGVEVTQSGKVGRGFQMCRAGDSSTFAPAPGRMIGMPQWQRFSEGGAAAHPCICSKDQMHGCYPLMVQKGGAA
jgi:hypothetical protein